MKIIFRLDFVASYYLKAIINISVLMMIIFAFGCKQETLDIPDTGSKIVINSLLESDSLIGCNITNSIYITSDSSVSSLNNQINNAKVAVFENGILFDSLKYSVSYFQSFDLTNLVNNYVSRSFHPKPGNQYKIKIDVFGKAEATATTAIPDIVKIDKIDTTRVILTSPGWLLSNVDMVFDIYFTDPGNEKNYYLIFMPGDPEKGTFQDPIVEEYLNSGTINFGIAFSDKTFNGQQHRTTLTINGSGIGYPFINNQAYPPITKTVLNFKLYSITEDYFNYIHTLNLFLKNYNNPLANPTQVYSNIQGGYGIFAGASVSSDSIVFH